MDLGRPTKSGITICGNTTTSRSGKRGKTVFTAAHRKNNTKIFWSVDDTFIGTTQNFHELALDPAVGKHIVTLVDERGSGISSQFEILEKGKQ